VCVCVCQRLNKPVSNKHPCSSWIVFGFLWMVFGFLFVVSNQDPFCPFLSLYLSMRVSVYMVVRIYALRLHSLSLSLHSRFQSLTLSVSNSFSLFLSPSIHILNLPCIYAYSPHMTYIYIYKHTSLLESSNRSW